MSGGVPNPLQAAGGIRLAEEARKARRRLYPVTVVYTLFSTVTLLLSLRPTRWASPLLFYGLGFVLWTWVEYEVHRYVLHGRFPDGPGAWQHFLHKTFDHLHVEHHARPWDGNHVNGTLKDTVLFVLLFAATAFGLEARFPALAGTATLLVAGVVQAYIAEEWVHHSVHFSNFQSRYFRYIKRHHLYHHSPKGAEVAYGLTNGMWDVVYETRIPEEIRARLYAPPSRAA